MNLVKIFCYILFFSRIIQAQEEPKEVIMNFYYKNNNVTTKISEKKDKDAVDYAIYNNSYENTGWDFIYVSSYEKKYNKYNDSLKSYAMGYLEDALTKDRICNFYINVMHTNFYENNFKIPENVLFFEENLNYIKKKSKEIWIRINIGNKFIIYQQLMGLIERYNSAVEENKK